MENPHNWCPTSNVQQCIYLMFNSRKLHLWRQKTGLPHRYAGTPMLEYQLFLRLFLHALNRQRRHLKTTCSQHYWLQRPIEHQRFENELRKNGETCSNTPARRNADMATRRLKEPSNEFSQHKTRAEWVSENCESRRTGNISNKSVANWQCGRRIQSEGMSPQVCV